MGERAKEIEQLNKEIAILRLNSQHLVKQNDELEEIIKELDNYIESDEFNNTFHCCEERSKVKEDIRNILKGSDKE